MVLTTFEFMFLDLQKISLINVYQIYQINREVVIFMAKSLKLRLFFQNKACQFLVNV